MADATLSELVVRIKTDTASLERGLKDVSAQTHAAAGKMSTAFVLATAFADELRNAIKQISFLDWAKSAVEAASHITDLSQQIDFAASSLLNLQHLLIQNGSDIDQFTGAVNIMAANLGSAASGANQDAIKAFDKLHLSVMRLKDMGPEEAFYAIVKALAAVKNQSEQTDLGRSIFGRSFATLIPLIKDTNGEIGKAIKQMNDINGIQTDKAVTALDKLGDTIDGWWNDKKKDFLVGLGSIVALVQQANSIDDVYASSAINKAQIKRTQVAIANRTAEPSAPNDLQALLQKQRDYDAAIAADQQRLLASAPNRKEVNPAAGNNNGLLKPSEMAKKQAEINKSISDYVVKQREANVVAGTAKDQQEGLAAYYDLVNQLMSKGLTLQEAEIKIGPERKKQIEEMANATAKLKKEQEEAARFAGELKDQLSGALSSIAFSFKSAADSAKQFGLELAKSLFQRKVTGPLTDALFGSPGSTGLIDSVFKGIKLPSFAVGTDFVPHDMIAQIHQGERIVPAAQNRGGSEGASVRVTQVFNMQPGLAETVGVAIRNAAPTIAAAAHASVFQAMQNGGTESRVAGLRS